MNLTPLEDRVVVLQDEAEKETASGLAIPDISQQKPSRGTIVKVGPGKQGKDSPIGYLLDDVFYSSLNGNNLTVGQRVVPVYTMAIKEGDKVFFARYAGTEIEHNGKKYLVMRISDLISRL